MKHLISRASAVVLVLAAALTAACSNNDPMAPRAANAVRTPSTGPVRASGYAVSWGRDSSTTGTSTGTGTASSGYAVSWGKDGGKNGNPSTPDVPTSGYAVSWGKDGGPSPDGQ